MHHRTLPFFYAFGTKTALLKIFELAGQALRFVIFAILNLLLPRSASQIAWFFSVMKTRHSRAGRPPHTFINHNVSYFKVIVKLGNDGTPKFLLPNTQARLCAFVPFSQCVLSCQILTPTIQNTHTWPRAKRRHARRRSAVGGTQSQT